MLGGYHFNPDDITAAIGLEPTSVNAAGAGSGLDKPVPCYWELSTETVSGSVDVYKLVDELIKKVAPSADKILQIVKARNLSPQITVVLTLSTDQDAHCPDVGLGARAIRFLADLGAFYNIDYKLSKRI